MFRSHGPDFYANRVNQQQWQAFDRGTRRWLYGASAALSAVVLVIAL